MFDKAHFGRIVNFSINVFLGITLVLVGLGLSGSIQPMMFFQSFVVSMGVGYMICDLIPAPLWGQKLMVKAGIKNPLLFRLLSTAFGGLILITCISFFCQFVAVGGMLFKVWPHAWPYLYGSGYIVLVLFMPVCEKIAEILTN